MIVIKTKKKFRWYREFTRPKAGRGFYFFAGYRTGVIWLLKTRLTNGLSRVFSRQHFTVNWRLPKNLDRLGGKGEKSNAHGDDFS